MSLDVQIFTEGDVAVWEKPEGAVRVDVILRAGDGGGKEGAQGEMLVQSYPANEIGDAVDVSVGRGGRSVNGEPDGFGGYAVVITHLIEMAERIGVAADGEPVGITLMAAHRGEYTCRECGDSAAGEWDGDPGSTNMANLALNEGAEHARKTGHHVDLDSRAHAR